MQTQAIHYSRSMILAMFKGVSHDDLKWTINYLMSLLEIPEQQKEETRAENQDEDYSPRIQRLLSFPTRKLSASEINDDVRLQAILERRNAFSLIQM